MDYNINLRLILILGVVFGHLRAKYMLVELEEFLEITQTPRECCENFDVPEFCLGLCTPASEARSVLGQQLNACSKFESIIEQCFDGAFQDEEKHELEARRRPHFGKIRCIFGRCRGNGGKGTGKGQKCPFWKKIIGKCRHKNPIEPNIQKQPWYKRWNKNNAPKVPKPGTPGRWRIWANKLKMKWGRFVAAVKERYKNGGSMLGVAPEVILTAIGLSLPPIQNVNPNQDYPTENPNGDYPTDFPDYPAIINQN